MKSRNKIKLVVAMLFVIICVTNRCECEDDSLEVPSEIDVVGTWILRSAEFRDDDVDFDGDGPLLPVKDFKYILLDFLNVYATCSSIDEIPIQFSAELTAPVTSANPTHKYRVYAVCPAGQGITSQIAAYYMDPYRSDAFYLEMEEINDPSNLIDWEGKMLIIITEELTSDGVRFMYGHSAIIPHGSSRYQHFDLVFEEYLEE